MAPTTAISSDRWQSFGQALRLLRRRNRLTQEELARAVGYSREQITHLESGRRKPDLTTVAALFIPALNLQDDPNSATRLLDLATAARAATHSDQTDQHDDDNQDS